MNGKNIEKLVLANRLVISGVVLGVLVFTTVPNLHNNSHHHEDSTLATLFATMNFTPELNIPIAGEAKENTEKTTSENPVASNEQSDDHSDATENAAANTDSNHSEANEPNAENIKSNHQASVYTDRAYSAQQSSYNTNSAKSAQGSSRSQSNSSHKTTLSTETNSKYTYTDENYENIDSVNPTPIPFVTPANHDDDNSTSDQPSKDLNPTAPSTPTIESSELQDSTDLGTNE